MLALCRNEAIAEEVTQETFFKAMRHINEFNGSCKLYVWLCQIAKNTYISLYQKQKRSIPGAEPELSEAAPDLEKDYLDKEAVRRLHVLLHNLKEAEAVKKLSKEWKNGMLKSLIKGILITAATVLIIY